MSKALILVVVFAVCPAVARASGIDSATLVPSADSRVKLDSPDRNYGDRPYLRIKYRDEINTLVRFDPTDLAAAAGDGTVLSATLRLFIEENQSGRGRNHQTLAVHALQANWSEAGVTWNCPHDGNPRNDRPDCAPTWKGGTRNATASAVLPLPEDQEGWIKFDVTADVRAFLSGTPNFGWLIRRSDTEQRGIVKMSSAEGLPGRQPELVLRIHGKKPTPAPTSTPRRTKTPGPPATSKPTVPPPTAKPTMTAPPETPTFTPSATPTMTESPTVVPTDTATTMPTDTSTPSPEPTDTMTLTPTPSDTPTPMDTVTSTPTDTATPTPTDTETPTPTDTPTFAPTDTATASPSPSSTPTPMARPIPTDVSRVWVGGDAAAAQDWSNPANWSPAGVPTSTDVVLIPAAATDQPQLSAPASAFGLYLEDGAVLDTSGSALTIGGWLDGGVLTGFGSVFMTGADGMVRGTMPNLRVAGTVSANGDVVVGTVFFVTGVFTVNAQEVTANVFLTGDQGVLVMQHPDDRVEVQSHAEFNGGSTAGLLTAGVLSLGGGFVQSNNDGSGASDSFSASGTHRVVFQGSGPQNVFFYTPGREPYMSHFQDVELANVGGSLSVGMVVANGRLDAPAGVGVTVFGDGSPVTVGGVDVDGLVLDNVPLMIMGDPIVAFDNVTFQNYAPFATQLTIVHPGAASPFMFHNLAFLVEPDVGLYVSATDSAVDAGTLDLELSCAQPPDGSAFTAVAGGASVSWLGCAE